jgi:hypothetical protein
MTELYQVNRVGSDYVELSADSIEVKIRFAGSSKEEEHAQFFNGVRGYVGLESRVLDYDFKTPCTINLFLKPSEQIEAAPFPFPVSSINVIRGFRVLSV